MSNQRTNQARKGKEVLGFCASAKILTKDTAPIPRKRGGFRNNKELRWGNKFQRQGYLWGQWVEEKGEDYW